MTLREYCRVMAQELTKAGIENGSFEAKQLCCFAFGISEKELLLSQEQLSGAQRQKAEVLLQKRCGGMPLQYLLGEWEFFSLPFFCGGRSADPAAGYRNSLRSRLILFTWQTGTEGDRPLQRQRMHRCHSGSLCAGKSGLCFGKVKKGADLLKPEPETEPQRYQNHRGRRTLPEDRRERI